MLRLSVLTAFKKPERESLKDVQDRQSLPSLPCIKWHRRHQGPPGGCGLKWCCDETAKNTNKDENSKRRSKRTEKRNAGNQIDRPQPDSQVQAELCLWLLGAQPQARWERNRTKAVRTRTAEGLRA